MNGCQTRNGRVVGRNLCEEVGEPRERCSLSGVLRLDEHAPVTGPGQLVKQVLAHLAAFVEERLFLAPPADDIERLLHGGVARGGGGQRRCGEQIEVCRPDGPERGCWTSGTLEEEGLTCSSHAVGRAVRRASSALPLSVQGGLGKALLAIGLRP
jgi:hypothetical protein